MATQRKRRIVCGDNLNIMKEIESESADLIYNDPPFFTDRKYEIIWPDNSEVRGFNDRFVTNKRSSDEEPTRSVKDINVYLEWMEARIREMYRILKKTGTFYLHCDYHADAYLRVLCDSIFQRDPLNRICWVRTNAKGRATNKFNVNHDVILVYTKTDNYTFNQQFVMQEEIPKGAKKDENGWYVTQPLIVKKRSSENKTRIINGQSMTLDDEHSWYATQEAIDQYEGIEITSNGIPRYKKYVSTAKPVDDVWTNMYLHPSSKERLGYPTQKPESLLERIIKASSNEHDVVMDFFCGCGTTLAVAQKLNRQFVGIDISPTACRLVAKRIHMSIKDIEGLPITSEEIAELNGNEFQNWVIREFGGFPGKRGADGGIDGMLGDCPIQVKKFKAGRPALDAFSGTLMREKKKYGIFIALDFSSDFVKEIARLKRENEVEIFIFSIEDILNRKHYPVVDRFIPKHGLDKFSKKIEFGLDKFQNKEE